MAGTMMAVVAGVVIVASSLLFTMIAFPDYAQAVEDATRLTLAQQGMTSAEIAAAIDANAASRTPMAQAMSGFVGTLITGIVASAAIGYSCVRRHDAREGGFRLEASTLSSPQA